jgi:Flp pilus assembly protein TadD
MGFAHYLLGLLLLDTDNFHSAIPELETARKSLPREAKLYFALASAYSRAGRKLDARQARITFQRLKESAGRAADSSEIGLTDDAHQKHTAHSPAPQ